MTHRGKPIVEAGTTAEVQVLQRLRDSQLVSDEQIEACRRALGPLAADSAALLQELTRRGLLTQWQVDGLRAGRVDFNLGKYRLLEPLGQGGMGTVYRAMHVALQRPVAVKTLVSKMLKDPGAVARFHREIQAIAALDHPNIVAAYDADCVGDTNFLVMEIVAGEDLDRLVKRSGSLPLGEACEYVRQAALGLQHAHERGLAHRDIKPSNLLLTRTAEGVPLIKLLDLGLARFAVASGDDGLTQTGQIMGTPDYIAPEQAHNSKNADIRSDIFSLGCTLYRLVTNRLPFPGENLMEKLLARVQRDAPPLSSLRAEVPAALTAVVARMLARDPAARYQTPADVAQALTPFVRVSHTAPLAKVVASPSAGPAVVLPVAGSPETRPQLAGQMLEAIAGHAPLAQAGAISLPPVAGRARSAARRPYRWRVVAATLGVLLAVAVMIAGASVWQGRRMATLIVDWPEAERTGGALKIDGVSFAVPAQGELRFRRAAGPRVIRLSRKGYETISQTRELPTGGMATIQPTWQPTVATMRRNGLQALKTRVAGVTDFDPIRPETAALRADLVRFVREHIGTSESSAATDLLPRLPWPSDALQRDRIPAIELQLAGRGLPSGAPAELVGVLGSGRMRHWGCVRFLSYAPEGKSLLVVGDTNAAVWNVASSSPEVFLERAAFPAAISWGRRQVATGLVDTESVIVWNLDSGTRARELYDNFSPPTALAFSPEGRYLACGAMNGKVVVWDLDQAERAAVVWKESEPNVTSATDGGGALLPRVKALAYSPDGQRLACACETGPVKVWQTGTKQELLSLALERERLNALTFNTDGTLLAAALSDSADGGVGKVRIWDARSGQVIRELGTYDRTRLNEAFPAVASVTFSPDGRTLAAASNGLAGSRSIHVWNVTDWSLRFTQVRTDDLAWAVAVTPDSRILTAGTGAGGILNWNVDTGDRLPAVEPGHKSAALRVAVAPDGTTVATSGVDGTAVLWNLPDGRPQQTLPRQVCSVSGIAFSSDGRSLAIFGQNFKLQHWNADNGELLRDVDFTGGVRAYLKLSADGRRLLAANVDTAVVYDAAIEHEIGRLNGTLEIRSAAISPDGKTLAIALINYAVVNQQPRVFVQIWDVDEQRLVETHDTNSSVSSIAFSPSGKQVLIAAGNVFLLELDRQRVRQAFDESTSIVAFDPQGTRFAALNGDKLNVVDLDSGLPAQTIQFAPFWCGANDVAFTPDGRHLITANGNGTAYVFRLAPWKPLPP